jgi:NAD(P)-dependent dehydrogenase (short-subunit alcohol dehydrogenase family)
MSDWSEQVAVVTGGGSGIGGGMCQAFARGDMRVAVVDVDLAAAEATARQIGNGARAFACDVADRSAVEALADQVRAAFGRVDLVCNNAGVLVGGPMLETTEDDWQWLLSVNVMGVVHGSQIFGRILAEQGHGHIVNTASVGGFLPYPDLAIYCTTKFAVVAFSEALRTELAPRGVGVSILCPGKVRTNLSAADRLRPDKHGRAGGSSKALGPLEDGMDPLEVGERVLRGVAANAEYIFTHAEFRGLFEERFARVLKGFDAAE